MGKMIWQAVEHPRPDALRALLLFAVDARSDAWTARFRGVADRLRGHRAAVRARGGDAHRRGRPRHSRRPADAHARREARHPRAEAGARADHACRRAPGTVGLSAVDFKLTDRYADVPENQDWPDRGAAADGRLRLSVPARRLPRRSIRSTARRSALPTMRSSSARSSRGLKLSRRCLGAVARGARARFRARKLAFSPVAPGASPGRTSRLAAAAGIAPDRLLFLPQGRDDAENQARYELVDFVLDPMPYGGVNGTLEALDMGVPVVTLVGKRHGERSVVFDPGQPRRHRDDRADRPRVRGDRRAARGRSPRSCATCAPRSVPVLPLRR